MSNSKRSIGPATNDLLFDLLMDWEDSFKEGVEKSAEELLGPNHGLVEELNKRIKALKATEWMDESEPVVQKAGQDYSGQTINGRYLIEGCLGAGGHASVWAALDKDLDRRVAIKIPHNAIAASKLQAEGRRIALLKHGNILPVYDYGTWGKLTFIVTELVSGDSLEKVLEQGRPSAHKISRIIKDVAGALDHAHGHQMVHLDVKPSNILMERDGTARLCDFGVSVSSASPVEGVFGTLQFMAPEQVLGEPVSSQTDIYALGVLLHYLYTGELPYLSKSTVQLRDEIASGSIYLAADLPLHIERVCRRALAFDPAKRYATATALAKDIAPRRGSRFAPLAMLLLLVLPASVALNSRITVFPKVDEAWLAHVQQMPPEEQIEAVQRDLMNRNPSLTDPGKGVVKDGAVVEYELITDHVTDLTPLQGFRRLEKLKAAGTRSSKGNGRVTDLRPLSGMGIKWLSVTYNPELKDLSPLATLPLEFLNCGECDISDLSPLRYCPLKVLVCGFNPISDLGPLRGLALEELHCNTTKVRDLGPVAGMPLREVRCQDSQVDGLEPLKGAPLGLLECQRTNVTDIAPLAGNPVMWGLNMYSTQVPDKSVLLTLPKLRQLALSYNPKTDREVLSKVTSLEEINSKPAKKFLELNEVGPALLK